MSELSTPFQPKAVSFNKFRSLPFEMDEPPILAVTNV
jgi:hypothetical protein